MLRRLLIVLVLLGACVAAAMLYVTRPVTVDASTLPQRQANLDNGRAMFNIGGCASCHLSAGQKDKTQLGGGLGLKSPFGTFYAPNISQHPQDGIGNWTEAQFISALAHGTSATGQHLFPALPYTSYQRMKRDDLRDMYAYVRTLPQVAGRVRDHDIGFPFNIRLSLGGWKLLFLDGKEFTPDPAQSAEWNRGAYLANGPGHCAECHSPRNLLGGIRAGMRFSGGPSPDGEGFIPNITQARLKDWSTKDLVFFFESGQTPDGDSTGGEMTTVVDNLSRLPASDREALALYIKSLAPVEGVRRAEKAK